MEPEVGCPLWYVRHDFYMMHLSSGLAAGYTNGVSQSSDSWFPCEIPMFEWLYPNHPIHNLHHIISYHIISYHIYKEWSFPSISQSSPSSWDIYYHHMNIISNGFQWNIGGISLYYHYYPIFSPFYRGFPLVFWVETVVVPSFPRPVAGVRSAPGAAPRPSTPLSRCGRRGCCPGCGTTSAAGAATTNPRPSPLRCRGKPRRTNLMPFLVVLVDDLGWCGMMWDDLLGQYWWFMMIWDQF